MARLNEILVGRFARGLQKLFGIKGTVPVSTLAPEIMPVHTDFSGTENRYLEGWNRFGIQVQQAAVAAQTGGVRLRNPTGSNVIIVVEKLLYANLTPTADTGQLLISTATADLATIVALTNARFDPRGNPQPTAVMSSTTNPGSLGPGTAKAAWQANATSNYDVIGTDIQEFPLLPGDAAQVQSVAVNLQVNVIWWWRERFLEESERM
jgi:hypothetical protein